MGVNYKIVDDNIVFKVEDADKVVEEIRLSLDKEFECRPKDGCESGFEVSFEEEYLNDDPSSEAVMALTIVKPDIDLIIVYMAKSPALVCVNGEFAHYWDLAFSSSTVTKIYADGTETEVTGHFEDLIMESL